MKTWIWMGWITFITSIYCAPAHMLNEQPVSIQDSITLSEEIDSLHMGYDRGYNDGLFLGRHENTDGLLSYMALNSCLGGLGGIIGAALGAAIGSEFNAGCIGYITGTAVVSTPLVVYAANNKYMPDTVPLGDSLYLVGLIDGYNKKSRKKLYTVLNAILGGAFALIPLIIIPSLPVW